ncbi:hypothetical protein LEP1GSC133_3870 [Leptospira borgpetersenii serovar Pomona str. 200901868]|uniref:Uncharacterized protein n=1 Tax=Leptospira borgpetersenii serovar Pomona str. 200901868 TaxID=1192866 RepID=M6WAL0_LEPBO|nr:hypothetical protein LEP1GSC133_3870 [Leptospira borgpetersenii serovar Pomona str. 200901868]
MFRKGSYLVLIVLFAIDCGKSKKEDLQGGVFTFIKGSIKLSDKAGKEKKLGFRNLSFRKIKSKRQKIHTRIFN